MKYCEKCKVRIPNPKEKCPLCQGMLSAGDGSERETFPNIPTVYKQYSLYFKILILSSVAAGLICVMINLLVPQSGVWSLIVVGGLLCMWVPLWTAIRKKGNLSKNILYQAVVLSVLITLWDIFTGWHRWSVNFVIPALCISAMLGIAIVGQVMHLHPEEYIVYLLIDIVFGAAPLVFFLTGLANVGWLCLISVVISVICLTTVCLFSPIDIRQELRKRLHL